MMDGRYMQFYMHHCFIQKLLPLFMDSLSSCEIGIKNTILEACYAKVLSHVLVTSDMSLDW
jgi:hypothetical protein